MDGEHERQPMIGIGLPQVGVTRAVTGDELGTALDLVEEAGFASAWVLEVQLGPASVLDPLSVLAFAAARTRAVRLGVSVVALPLHQPVLLARTIASVDRLSGGRTILGLGTGGGHLPFAAFGGHGDERRARFDEYLDVMRALWSGDAVSRAGRFVSLSGATVNPKPLQPSLPVWLGGGSTWALRRAVRLADGWVGPGLASTAQLRQTAARLHELLEQREPDQVRPFTIAKRVLVAIGREPDEVDAWFRAVYGRPAPHADVIAVGDPAAVAEQLADVQEAGADHLIVQPVGGDELRQIQALGDDVLPALRPIGSGR